MDPTYTAADIKRFWATVKKGKQYAPGGCWLWMGVLERALISQTHPAASGAAEVRRG